ncbi:LysR family transcriptional regulator [Megamonas hypermegale]|nr:LysR family transcriptional regulator [Megamonas hypermegale]
MMNLKDMNCFIVVCDKKSITAAAEILFLSPQALSKTIQKMEKEVDAELFIRSSNGVKMTAYGEILYNSAKNILNEYDDMVAKIRSLTMQNKGILRMASAFGILRFLTPEFINVFAQKNPQMHLEYMEFPDKYVLENIINKHCDIGLIPYTEKNNELEYIDLFKVEIFFITHKESDYYNCKEVSLKNVVTEPLIVENENFIIRQILLNLCYKEHIQPNIYFNTSGFSLSYKLCKEGKGNTISMDFIFEDMKDKSLRKIPFQEHPMWNVAIVYRKDCFLSDNMKKLIQFSCEWCKILN